MNTGNERVDLKVLVSDQYRERLPQVVQSLQAAGMDIKQQLDALGVVTGSADAAQVDTISHIDGVAHVSRERHYQLAPPDSKVQ